MITLLNSPRLTTYGTYRYHPITLDAARALVAQGFTSAVGHQSTAERISELLGVVVLCARRDYVQSLGELALVFQLKSRLPEGIILEYADLERVDYEFGLLERLA